jgi:hypothetical protein
MRGIPNPELLAEILDMPHCFRAPALEHFTEAFQQALALDLPRASLEGLASGYSSPAMEAAEAGAGCRLVCN